MNCKIILAPTATTARSASADITIEAEYGSYVWEGSLFTAAHHQATGPYQGRHQGGDQPSPCNNEGIPVLSKGGVIGVSHFDLDTLGGVLRAIGAQNFFSGQESFWALAEFIDVTGPHRLSESGASEEDLERLYAFWAWSSKNRIPRMTEVTDVTPFFAAAAEVLLLALTGDEEVLASGEAFKEAGAKLNRESFLSVSDDVVIRVSPGFTNHLYALPEGEEVFSTGETVVRSVLAFNTRTGSITLSFSEEFGLSACDVVQAEFGPEAGGHRGIAGSPRGERCSLGQLNRLALVVQDDITTALAVMAEGE